MAGNRILASTALLLALLALLAPDLAHASNAGQYYQDAQSAFRKGQYANAVEGYLAADRAGFDDLILFYNLGVTYYKLQEYEQAESAFATASTSPGLAPLAYYNLGLVARKVGDTRDARGWFEQTRMHPTTSPKLRKLSVRALETSSPARAKKPQFYVDREDPLRDFFRFSFDSGFATDSNIYRAPGESYIDLADVNNPVIDPTVQSGTFVPMTADAEFRWGTHDDSRFMLAYDFDGRVYTDPAYSNANTFKNEISLGGRAMIPTQTGYRYFHSRFLVAHYNEDYYNRDDGQDQLVGTTDVSDRFERTKWGPKAYYHRKRGWLGYGFRAEGFINNYAETLEYLDLTHEQYLAGAHVSYYPLEGTELRFGYDWYRRLYTERRAKDANGIRFTNNDKLEYDYGNYQLKLRQKLWHRWSLNLAYKLTSRTDNFEGYDDYDRHTALGSLSYRGRRFDVDGGFTWRTYDFPNAFTFDLASEGAKTLDTTYAHMQLSYQVFDRYTVRVEGQMDIVDASDPRAKYDRNQIAVSIAWAM